MSTMSDTAPNQSASPSRKRSRPEDEVEPSPIKSEELHETPVSAALFASPTIESGHDTPMASIEPNPHSKSHVSSAAVTQPTPTLTNSPSGTASAQTLPSSNSIPSDTIVSSTMSSETLSVPGAKPTKRRKLTPQEKAEQEAERAKKEAEKAAKEAKRAAEKTKKEEEARKKAEEQAEKKKARELEKQQKELEKQQKEDEKRKRAEAKEAEKQKKEKVSLLVACYDFRLLCAHFRAGPNAAVFLVFWWRPFISCPIERCQSAESVPESVKTYVSHQGIRSAEVYVARTRVASCTYADP
jgi:hypothetical protein